MLQYQLLNFVLHAIIFFMGAAIGSFLNVVIYRLPLGISVNNPRRSFCPSCKAPIPFYHNIPIVSWLLLRGRCAKCKGAISPRYLGVELLVGLLFYAVFWKVAHEAHWWDSARDFANAGPLDIWRPAIFKGWAPQVLCLWIFVSLLVAGTFIDIDHFILPHEITWGGTVVGLVCASLVPGLVGEATHLRGFLNSFGSAAAALGGLWLVIELGKLAFGRKRFAFKKAVPWSITQPDDTKPPVLTVDGKAHDWLDLFNRESDRLLVACPRITLNGKTSQEVKIDLNCETLKMTPVAGGETKSLPLEDLTEIHGTTTEIVIPREAMGHGDAFLLMLIGSFAGWQAVIFTIFCASVLGSVLAGFWRLVGRSEWGAKIPFGPYLAAGAMLWVFWGPQVVGWYVGKVFAHHSVG